MIKVIYEAIYETNENEPWDMIILEGLFDDNLTTTELIMELEDIIHYNWKRGRLGNWRIVDENLA